MTLKIIAGKFKNQKLSAPDDIRPATSLVRNAIFNICQNFIEDTNFLDIFSGSGAIGIEALSRGAKFSTFIDKSFNSCKFIKANIKKLNLEKDTKVICLDAIKAVESLNTKFDIISIDPPFIFYKENPKYLDDLLKLLQKKLIHKNSIIFLEQPTYAIREENIEGLILQNKRRYSSAYLLEYVLG
ncbi:MAG: 16S rRNA (guanine(966)-N(2))-methyltransferase RsmD [Parachlamydiales bacterium]|jgi:16S rRNA (guanine(966)-N(2))-methyltransferase RsmD